MDKEKAISILNEWMSEEADPKQAESLELLFKELNEQEPLQAEIERLNRLLQKLLNKVNRVTSSYRHSGTVNPDSVAELSNRQLEIEEALNKGEE